MLSLQSWKKLLNESSSLAMPTTELHKVYSFFSLVVMWISGPIINEGGIQKVIEHIDDAVKKGATIVTGGKRLNGFTRYIEPTILTNVPRDALALNDETFGPRKFYSNFPS